ncbi:MAG: serine/threonine-protein kinase, partial [Planctomycetota bacterium]
MAIEDPKTGKKTLAQIIAGGAFLSAHQAAEATLQLLTLLETLYSEGQIHRNITPETVLLTQNMKITLEAVKAEVSLGGIEPDAIPCPPSLRTGRPLLLPAEINAVEDILTQAGILLDPQKIDFYQLGTLLCFMVSGHEISDYLRSCRTKADVPKSLRPIIDTALGLNHNDCFPSGKAFADALESLISGDSESKTAVSQLPESIFTESGTNSKPVTAENDQLPFDTLSHYKIIGRIGHGGMGDVYKAYEKSLDRFVAIKVLPAELSRQKDFAKRFQVEAAAVAQLDHPNIVQVYYCGCDKEHHFFVMQYVEGESLAELLARRGKLNVNEALPVIKQCLAGLIAVHQNGLIHRDIKPGN